MAPTTLIGEKQLHAKQEGITTYTGHPTHMCELINTLKAPVFIERVSLANPLKIRLAKFAIKQALTVQRKEKDIHLLKFVTPY